MDVNGQDALGRTPLHDAVESSLNHDNNVALLLSQPTINLNINDADGHTALYYAIKNPQLTHRAKLMIDTLSDVDKIRDHGETLLMLALRFNNLDIARHLIAKGASPNSTNSAGESALQLAMKTQHLEIAEQLLHKGGSIYHKDNNGRTALHYAAAHTNQALMRLTLNQINKQNFVMRQLYSKSWYINTQDKHGQTALHAAYQHNNSETIELLKSLGADQRTIDQYGKIPQDHANKDRALNDSAQTDNNNINTYNSRESETDDLILRYHEPHIPTLKSQTAHSTIAQVSRARASGDINGFPLRVQLRYKQGALSKLGAAIVNKSLSFVANLRAERFIQSALSTTTIIVVLRDEDGNRVHTESGYTNKYGELLQDIHFDAAIPPGQYRADIYAPEEKGALLGHAGSLPVLIKAPTETTDRADTTGINRLSIYDIDNTLFPTNSFSCAFNLKALTSWQEQPFFGLINGVNRLPYEYRFYEGMPELLQHNEVNGDTLAVSASPSSLLNDFSTIFDNHNIQASTGIGLKNWSTHFFSAGALHQQYGYKIESILTQLSHTPAGTELDFYGDDKEHDAEIYSDIRRLITEDDFTPDAFAQMFKEKNTLPIALYGEDRIRTLAERVKSRNHKVNGIYIRQYRPNVKKVDEAVRRNIIYIRGGYEALINKLHRREIESTEFLNRLVEPKRQEILREYREHCENNPGADFKPSIVEKLESAVHYWLNESRQLHPSAHAGRRKFSDKLIHEINRYCQEIFNP